MTAQASQHYSFWAIFERDAGAEDPWVVHCLELDIVTQGRTLAHACNMLAEAVSLVLLDDLNNGHNPLERRAPEESWEKLYELLRTGRRVEDMRGMLEAEPADLDSFAATMEIGVTRHEGAPAWTFPASAFAANAPAARP